MSKFSLILIIAVMALGGSLWLSVNHSRKVEHERDRLTTNQSALFSQLRTYEVRDSLNAVSIQALTLTKSELERHFSSLTALVQDMKLKIKNVESISQTSISSSYRVAAPIIDTVIMRDTLKSLRFRNCHINIDGVIDRGQFLGSIESYDTLSQVIHRVPRKFWFIRWGTKELRQEIVSSNPHTRITYSRLIKLRK